MRRSRRLRFPGRWSLPLRPRPVRVSCIGVIQGIYSRLFSLKSFAGPLLQDNLLCLVLRAGQVARGIERACRRAFETARLGRIVQRSGRLERPLNLMRLAGSRESCAAPGAHLSTVE